MHLPFCPAMLAWMEHAGTYTCNILEFHVQRYDLNFKSTVQNRCTSQMGDVYSLDGRWFNFQNIWRHWVGSFKFKIQTILLQMIQTKTIDCIDRVLMWTFKKKRKEYLVDSSISSKLPYLAICIAKGKKTVAKHDENAIQNAQVETKIEIERAWTSAKTKITQLLSLVQLKRVVCVSWAID